MKILLMYRSILSSHVYLPVIAFHSTKDGKLYFCGLLKVFFRTQTSLDVNSSHKFEIHFNIKSCLALYVHVWRERGCVR